MTLPFEASPPYATWQLKVLNDLSIKAERMDLLLVRLPAEYRVPVLTYFRERSN